MAIKVSVLGRGGVVSTSEARFERTVLTIRGRTFIVSGHWKIGAGVVTLDDPKVYRQIVDFIESIKVQNPTEGAQAYLDVH